MNNYLKLPVFLILICSIFVACTKSNSSSPNTNQQSGGCRLTGITYRSFQVVDSQSWILNYDANDRLVQVYSNPGGITTHINYTNSGKISTITGSSTPNRDTIIYDGDNISASITLASDGTPLDTTIVSVNADGWITDIRVNLRLNRLTPSIYGHVTYNYENGALKSIYQSVENLQSPHPTSVYLDNNLPVPDPKNPFFSSSREMLLLFYQVFNVDALGSGWTAGNIESLNFTDPTKISYETQYNYTLDNNKNVIHRDILLAATAPFNSFGIIANNNYTYECK